MDAAQLIAELAFQERLPVETIRAASADWARAAPIFVHAIEQFASPDGDRTAKDSLFFIFHLLGDWREKSAYRPLARLLRCSPDDVDEILGGSITETTHRVMAAVFDGDPGPLYEVILDPEADEYVRSRMLEAIAMVTLRGEMPRAEAARFLRACYSELEPQDECWIWHGWQSAIALLGLVELKPLVEQAFARGFISNGWLEFKHFEQDLQLAIDDPAALVRQSDGEYSLFGDTIEELSTWYCFRPEEVRRKEEEITRKEREKIQQNTVLWRAGTAVNRYKNVGRNDPCPCGSGRKFKKCCLTADIGLTSLQAV
jgi:Protein of unknown function (DUF1186)/SEC-C motif